MSVSYASPPPSNEVYICEVLDYEDMRARDSLYAATKQALNLNVGEPRTVRMIYFLPNDRPFQQAVVDSMKVTIRQIQTFFADQMEAHGYGRKTFRFETDLPADAGEAGAQGEPVVHRVDGQHTNSYYLERPDSWHYWQEIGQKFDTRANNVYLTVWDNGTGGIRPGLRGIGSGGRDSGAAWVSAKFDWRLVAHELGHAFGLLHDFRSDAYIMSYGFSRVSLSACAAEFLAVHPYFNPDIPDEETSGPTIELISPNEYPTGSTSVSVQLKVSDPDGLHQVILFVDTRAIYVGGGDQVKTCRGLNGEKEAVVEFDYDGVVPSGVTSLSDPRAHRIYVEAVDSFGNVGTTRFTLFDISTQRNLIATLAGHTGRVNSVSFSPDGTILASGSWNGTVKLWDVATRTEIAALKEFNVVRSLSFSPDGTLLAYVRWPGVKLWDVATRTEIATLEEQRHIYSVAFSPDGKILASGSREGTILLWDMSPYIRPQTPTSAPTPDFDGDGIVGISDFLLFVDQFGLNQSDVGYEARFDLDGNGVIGISDFLIFVNAFGKKGS